MIIVAIITVPTLFTYDDDLSFNTVDEIGAKYETVKGLNAISDGFGAGESLPVNVILKSDDDLITEKTVPYAEQLSRELVKIDGSNRFVRFLVRQAKSSMISTSIVN